MRIRKSRRTWCDRSSLRAHRNYLAEALEARLLLYHTYVGEGNSSAKWNTTDLTYSIANTFDVKGADLGQAVIDALGVWTGVTPLKFTSATGNAPGTIAFKTTNLPDGFTNPGDWGWGTGGRPPGSTDPSSSDGDVSIYSAPIWSYDDLLAELTHSVGHALGQDGANGPYVHDPAPAPTPAVMDVFKGETDFTDGSGDTATTYLYPDDINGIGSLYGDGLGYVNDGGSLHIFGTGSADLMSVNVTGGNIIATSQYIVGAPDLVSFTRPMAGINKIYLHGLAGADDIRVENTGGLPVSVVGDGGNDTLEVQVSGRNLDNAPATVGGFLGDAPSISFNGGTGTDSAFLYDDNNPNPDAYQVNTDASVQRPAPGGRFAFSAVTYGGSLNVLDTVENVTLRTGLASNTVNVRGTPFGQTMFLNSSGGNDIVNVGDPSVFGSGLDTFRGPLRIDNTPSHTTVHIDDSKSSQNALFLNGGTIDSDGIYGSYHTDNYSGGTTISWRQVDTSAVTLVTSPWPGMTRVLRQANPLTITADNSQGADYIVLGAASNGLQSITAAITLSGINGRYDLAFDDTGDTTARSGAVSIPDTFTQVTGLAPSTIRYKGTRIVYYRTGAGADLLIFTDVADGGDNANLYLSDRGGTDNIQFMDRNTIGLFGTNYEFSTTGVNLYLRSSATAPRFLARQVTYDASTGFTLDNVSVYMTSLTTGATPSALVTGMPSGFLGQTTIRAGNGNNVITIIPRDASGNATMNSPLGIFGEGGTDSVVVDESAYANGASYSLFYGGFSTTDITGLGVSAMGVFSDVEALSLLAGAGADSLNVQSYQTATAFAFSGGGGNDTVQLTPGSGNLAATDVTTAIASGSPLSFDGGGGNDTFKLFNQNNASAWTYTLQGALLSAARSGTPAYNVNLNFTNQEETDVNAGSAADQFIVRDLASNGIDFLTGNGGADNFLVGGAAAAAPAPDGGIAPAAPAGNVLSGIRGLVGILGDAADTVTLDDGGDTTGRVAHIDQSFVGNFLHDTLFGPGGHAYFGGVGNVTVNLGSGADTIFAQLPTATAMHIVANGPTGAGGDVLNLAAAGTTNFLVTPGASGAGTVSATGRKSLTYTGIDQTPAVDSVAPSATAAAYLVDVPELQVSFSKDVSQSIMPSWFELTNVTTDQSIESDAIQIASYIANQAALKFPSLAGGTLADGNYHVSLPVQTISDNFGNYSTADFDADFFVLAGDANRDRHINSADFNVLAINFNKPGQTFTQGDFNYDGKVNALDFNVLATRFGTYLAPAVPAPSLIPSWSSTSRSQSSPNLFGSMRINPEQGLVDQPSTDLLV